MVNLLLAVIYLAFISLGLPDAIFGSVWPTMYEELGVPISYAGIISIIISFGTIFASLQSDRLTKKFGAGAVTAVSVGLTAIALFGFSVSNLFILLCLIAIPYGLGAGSVDSALNNYVALHYESRHMSWLHCMWGVGASLGPYIMGMALTGGLTWKSGYTYIFIIQAVIAIIMVFSLPLFKTKALSKVNDSDDTPVKTEPMKLKNVVKIKGVKLVMISFFCYCAIEQTLGLWASSYMHFNNGVPKEQAASWASLFFLGITAGRAVSGFLTMKLNDTKMIRLGEAIILVGVAVFLIPFGNYTSLIGLILIGLGCAPIFPCIIHSTPTNFGAENSQAVTGVQMASAYVGVLVMPPIFGLIAKVGLIKTLPIYIFILLVAMAIMYELLIKRVKAD